MLCQALDQKVTLEEAAREAALAPTQFIRAFKAVFGQTPHQMRIDARLELAKRLLIADSMPVTDVCAAVGFASLGTFSHVFTRRIGSSPSAFRREARTLVQVPGMLPLKLYPGCFTLMAYLPEGRPPSPRISSGTPTNRCASCVSPTASPSSTSRRPARSPSA
jgi:AraC-like DNA-binding protein